MTSEHRAGEDEVVDEDEHAQDDEHDRDTALVGVAGEGQQVGDEADEQRGDDDLGHGERHGLRREAGLGHLAAAAQLAPCEERDARDADHDGQAVEWTPPPEELRQVVAGDAAELRRGDRHGFADDHGGEATEDEHAGQCGDEAGDAHVGHPEALPAADDQADDERDEDCEHPVDALPFHQYGAHTAYEGHDRADRQIDMRGDDNHDHADGEDDHVGVLLDERDEAVGLEQHALGEEFEDEHDDDERAHDAVLLRIVGQCREESRALLFCWGCIDGAHDATTSFSLVMPFMRYSWVNPFLRTSSVTTPWLTV